MPEAKITNEILHEKISMLFSYVKEFKEDMLEFKKETNKKFEQIELQRQADRAETNQRFNQIDKRFEQVDQRFNQIDQRFEQVDKRFDQSDKRLEQADRKSEQIINRLDRMEDKLDIVFEHRDKLEVKLTNRWAFAAFCMALLASGITFTIGKLHSSLL
jgi:septal ring factor EnvC (AmiA/AmiB activator)